MNELAERLKRLRLKRGLSVTEVARAIGVATSTYREWEQGRKIKGEPYQKLAELFEVALSELLTGFGGKKAILEDLRVIEKAVERIRMHL